MTAPAATASSGQFTVDLTRVLQGSSSLTALAGQSSSAASDLGKLVLDVATFAQIGSPVGAANTFLQSGLTQALGKVADLLKDVGQLVGASAQNYAAADQQVATSLGADAGAATRSGSDGDAFVDHFAATHAQGAHGREVREFQTELKQLGYDPGTPDGDWGPGTQRALAAYQAAHHYVAGAGTGTSIDLPGQLGTVTAPNQQAADAVRSALSQTGVAYKWGGKSPATGLDCSGLTRWAYGQAGVTIPEGSGNQAVGLPVPQSDLQPGDLAVWKGHVAMYIGEDKMVEAPHAGAHVHITPLRTSNAGDSFLGFYRPTAKR